MVEVSDLAQQKLQEYMQQNNLTSQLRVALMSSGCAGTSLGLSLDDKKEGDEVTEFDGLTVLINKELLTLCGDVHVDYIEADAQSGFKVSSTNPVGTTGGCASGSCSSCSG